MTASGGRNGRAAADAAIIASLAGGAKIADCARTANVSERTVTRRLEDPEFVARVSAARSDMLRQATARLSAGASEAVEALMELLDGELPPTVRLSAARVILDSGIRLRAEFEFGVRLDAIEGHLGIGGRE